MAENSRHQTEFYHSLFDRRALWLTYPGRVADIEAAHLDMRLPAEQVHLQVAVDLYFPPQPGRGVAPDGSAQLIPVQKIERDKQGKQQGREHNSRPAQETPAR